MEHVAITDGDLPLFIMNKTPTDVIIHTLKELIQIPSPTGLTDQVIRYLEQRLKPFELTMQTTNKGGLLVTLPGQDHAVQRFLTAHVDTLGMMVKEIKSDGRLRLTRIGGFSWHGVDGEYCRVHRQDGSQVTGTILAEHTSVHVYGEEVAKRERDAKSMEVRLDARVKSADEVRALGIEVGDFVSFDPRFEMTETGFIKSRHLDDKASVAILLELLCQVKQENRALPHTTHFYFSNWEEVGHGGSVMMPTGVREYLAVDMGAIGDGQATDEYCVSICAKDSSGPYHAGFRHKLVQLAQEAGIYYQVDIYPYYGSDASAALRAGHDVIHGLIGPGIDASHAFERTHRDSLENTYRLLNAYLQSPSL